MRWQTIASNVQYALSATYTTTPLPKAYDRVAVYIAGRRTSLVVYGWWPQPPTNKHSEIHSVSQSCSHDITSSPKITVEKEIWLRKACICHIKLVIRLGQHWLK